MDVIVLSGAGFLGALPFGVSSVTFTTGTAGATVNANRRLIWDEAAKELWFDANGNVNGAPDAVRIATFIGDVSLNIDMFLLL